MLLLPLPFAPMRTFTRPRFKLRSGMDLKFLIRTCWIISILGDENCNRYHFTTLRSKVKFAPELQRSSYSLGNLYLYRNLRSLFARRPTYGRVLGVASGV